MRRRDTEPTADHDATGLRVAIGKGQEGDARPATDLGDRRTREAAREHARTLELTENPSTVHAYQWMKNKVADRPSLALALRLQERGAEYLEGRGVMEFRLEGLKEGLAKILGRDKVGLILDWLINICLNELISSGIATKQDVFARTDTAIYITVPMVLNGRQTADVLKDFTELLVDTLKGELEGSLSMIEPIPAIQDALNSLKDAARDWSTIEFAFGLSEISNEGLEDLEPADILTRAHVAVRKADIATDIAQDRTRDVPRITSLNYRTFFRFVDYVATNVMKAKETMTDRQDLDQASKLIEWLESLRKNDIFSDNFTNAFHAELVYRRPKVSSECEVGLAKSKYSLQALSDLVYKAGAGCFQGVSHYIHVVIGSDRVSAGKLERRPVQVHSWRNQVRAFKGIVKLLDKVEMSVGEGTGTQNLKDRGVLIQKNPPILSPKAIDILSSLDGIDQEGISRILEEDPDFFFVLPVLSRVAAYRDTETSLSHTQQQEIYTEISRITGLLDDPYLSADAYKKLVMDIANLNNFIESGLGVNAISSATHEVIDRLLDDTSKGGHIMIGEIAAYRTGLRDAINLDRYQLLTPIADRIYNIYAQANSTGQKNEELEAFTRRHTQEIGFDKVIRVKELVRQGKKLQAISLIIKHYLHEDIIEDMPMEIPEHMLLYTKNVDEIHQQALDTMAEVTAYFPTASLDDDGRIFAIVLPTETREGESYFSVGLEGDEGDTIRLVVSKSFDEEARNVLDRSPIHFTTLQIDEPLGFLRESREGMLLLLSMLRRLFELIPSLEDIKRSEERTKRPFRLPLSGLVPGVAVLRDKLTSIRDNKLTVPQARVNIPSGDDIGLAIGEDGEIILPPSRFEGPMTEENIAVPDGEKVTGTEHTGSILRVDSGTFLPPEHQTPSEHLCTVDPSTEDTAQVDLAARINRERLNRRLKGGGPITEEQQGDTGIHDVSPLLAEMRGKSADDKSQ